MKYLLLLLSLITFNASAADVKYGLGDIVEFKMPTFYKNACLNKGVITGYKIGMKPMVLGHKTGIFYDIVIGYKHNHISCPATFKIDQDNMTLVKKHKIGEK